MKNGVVLVVAMMLGTFMYGHSLRERARERERKRERAHFLRTFSRFPRAVDLANKFIKSPLDQIAQLSWSKGIDTFPTSREPIRHVVGRMSCTSECLFVLSIPI